MNDTQSFDNPDYHNGHSVLTRPRGHVTQRPSQTWLARALSPDSLLAAAQVPSPQSFFELRESLASVQHRRAEVVPHLNREILVAPARTRREWQLALELVAANYTESGYEADPTCTARLTPHHALPESVTFIAQQADDVVMTMTMVPDNWVIGLPMEETYPEEIQSLRRQGRRLAETISLAASDSLGIREFRRTFETMIRMLMQQHVANGGDTWVIAVNPRHREFYTRAMGFTPVGGRRAYASALDNPAEAFMLDCKQMRERVPAMHLQMFGEWLPAHSLEHSPMPLHIASYLATQMAQKRVELLQKVLEARTRCGVTRAW